MRVIGTAGHVDHGKSTLVRALTGIDPDRLQEEKARGLTIDLGFAWMDLPQPDGSVESVGIVDVPGHIDFIKNMLAGVGSIDAAVLVIAADEGVMPQTREHLAILDLLAVPTGMVALTKVDLVDDPEWLALVELDVAELLQETRFAGAPIVPVSARTGAGLDELRQTLARLLGDLPPRRQRGRPRLPVDRVFTLSGFGTIVTGTLSDGHLAVGDAVEILPPGISARIRGLQSHRQPIQRAAPGSRVAINLSGVSADAIHRGDVVVKPGTLEPTLLVDVSFRLLADAPKPLTHNQPVDFFSGAAEVPARVRLLGTERLEPGQQGWLQLRLARPVVVAAGDRYILRQPSPSMTLGGGQILNPHPRRRWRRFDPAVLARFQTLAQGTPDEILLQTLARFPLTPAAELFAHSGLDLAVAQETLAELQRSGAALALDAGSEPVWLTPEAWEELVGRMARQVEHFHAQFPLRRGMPRGELRSRVLGQRDGGSLSVRIFNALIQRAQEQGLLEADDSVVWLPGFVPRPSPEQQARVDRLLAAFARAGMSPPNPGDVLRLLGGDEPLLEMLIEQGQLVRLGGGVLFRREEFEAAVAQVQAFLQEQGTITLAQARDLLQTSRKYAQALLEEMDARRITRREGDLRVLRAGLVDG
ncbi:selenocysteine-specific translation elongation factor [Litorilinea aerophila]|uniref:Selenocysteine-specific elongation factor n=1 Tax=Litorilinea aerophila TaxID=1204385 RepID=A0A540VFZ1_9CHLR|nr:selenocysteine-specific translation elongation factor [Litorilinea aerophila]